MSQSVKIESAALGASFIEAKLKTLYPPNGALLYLNDTDAEEIIASMIVTAPRMAIVIGNHESGVYRWCDIPIADILRIVVGPQSRLSVAKVSSRATSTRFAFGMTMDGELLNA